MYPYTQLTFTILITDLKSSDGLLVPLTNKHFDRSETKYLHVESISRRRIELTKSSLPKKRPAA